MRRATPFATVELAVFASAQGANAFALTPIPLWMRILGAVLILGFSLLGRYVPGTPRGRTLRLAADAVALAAILPFTPGAGFLSVLLVSRTMDLKPGDRAALTASVGGAAAFVAAAMFVGIHARHAPYGLLAAFVLIPFFALVIGLIVVANDLRLSHASLAAANVELALRAARLEEVATLAERYRIGRDLEAEVRRGLSTIHDQLEAAEKSLRSDPQAAGIGVFRARRTADFTLSSLRRRVSGLREESLVHGDLAAALRNLCEIFSAASGLRIAVSVGEVRVDDPLVVTSLERIAREALIYVARRRNATTVRLSVDVDEERLALVVEDDGPGPARTPSAAPDRALDDVRARARAIGARFDVEDAEPWGTRIRVTLPPAQRVS